MVKLKGPAVSTEATGSIADVLCFLKGKQATIAKKYATPGNKTTRPQLGVRAMVKFLAEQWKNLSSIEQATWEEPSQAQHFAPYHAYIKYNMIRWKTFRYPSTTYPAAEALTPTSAPGLFLTAKIKSIRVETNAWGSGVCWGYVHFQSTSNGFTPSPHNAVYVKTRDAWSTVFLLTPIETGTYYQRAFPFRRDGRPGNMSLQASVTVL